jgi:Leucine-rich repeat (LRR) protein
MKFLTIVIVLHSSITLIAMEKEDSVEHDGMKITRYSNQMVAMRLDDEQSNNNKQPRKKLNGTFGQQLAELLVLTNRNNNSIENKVTQEELEKYHHELTLAQREIVNFSKFIDLLHCYLSSPSSATILLSDFTLTRLDVSGNELSDLPQELAQATTLTSISICSNRFEKFPPVLYRMPWLKKIIACCNQIAQYTEEGFSQLKELERIDLSNNRLPIVPKSLLTLENLAECYFYNNPEIKKQKPSSAVYKTPPFYFEQPKTENNKTLRAIPKKNETLSFIDFLKKNKKQ